MSSPLWTAHREAARRALAAARSAAAAWDEAARSPSPRASERLARARSAAATAHLLACEKRELAEEASAGPSPEWGAYHDALALVRLALACDPCEAHDYAQDLAAAADACDAFAATSKGAVFRRSLATAANEARAAVRVCEIRLRQPDAPAPAPDLLEQAIVALEAALSAVRALR